MLVILAFLFPLTDDDQRRSPQNSDLIPPTLFQATPETLETPETVATVATATDTDIPVATSPDRTMPPSPQPDRITPTAPPTNTASATRTVVTPSATQVVATRTPTPEFICTPSPRAGWDLYTVRRGDTLQAIAQLVGASVAELAEANCLQDPNRITAGQSIWAPALPDPFATPTRTPRPTVTRTPTVTPTSSN